MKALEIADKVADLAGLIADCEDLDSRDANALIGQARSLAMALRGAPGLPGFRQRAFAPTTSGGFTPRTGPSEPGPAKFD